MATAPCDGVFYLSVTDDRVPSSDNNEPDQVKRHDCILRNFDFQRHFKSDPFVGILKRERLIRDACCSRMALTQLLLFYDNMPVTEFLTPFGQQLLNITKNRNFELVSFWLFYPYNRRNREQPDRLSTIASFTDSDNVIWSFATCSRCYGLGRYTRKPPCCRKPICQICWQRYVWSSSSHDALAVGLYGMYCLHCYGCKQLVPYSEATACTSQDDLNLVRRPEFYKAMKENVAASSTRCPTCLAKAPFITQDNAGSITSRPGGFPYKCTRCKIEFCLICGNKTHAKMACSDLIGETSEIAVTKWAKQSDPNTPGQQVRSYIHVYTIKLYPNFRMLNDALNANRG